MKDLKLDEIELTNDLLLIRPRDLQVRTLSPEERPRAAQLRDQEHPLGADRVVGLLQPAAQAGRVFGGKPSLTR